MATKCENCPLRRKEAFVEQTVDETKFMQKFKVGELVVDAGTPLMMEGMNSPQLYTALHGMGLRYKTLPNGRRQVINFIFPGDFIGLQAGVMREMSHSVEATTKMTLCVFDRAEFYAIFKNHPSRAFDMTWLAAVEEHFLGEALTSVGQRSALQAMCWALTRLFIRADSLGMVEKNEMRFPFRQQDIADALGLSLVHTNKTLAVIRDRQLAVWADGRLRVNDLEALASIAETDIERAVKRPIM